MSRAPKAGRNAYPAAAGVRAGTAPGGGRDEVLGTAARGPEPRVGTGRAMMPGMRPGARSLAAVLLAWSAAIAPAAPAWAQTGDLEAPSLWLLLISLAQIIGAAALMVFFITRRRTRSCPRCGRKLLRDARDCPRCGMDPRQAPKPGREGS